MSDDEISSIYYLGMFEYEPIHQKISTYSKYKTGNNLHYKILVKSRAAGLHGKKF